MAATERRRESAQSGVVPVLRARAGGPAERFADLVGGHPVAVFVVALLCGYAVLAGCSLLLALFVTDVLVQVGDIRRTDESAITSLVAERTGFLTDVSGVGSAVGGAPLLPILVGIIAIACALRRRWRLAAFAVFVLVVESATYRVTSWLVPRERPDVQRLEDLPADASYPSGHTAASIAVYAGLVLLLTSAFPDRRLRVFAWVTAIVLPVLVAMSRMYRGMHHPLDVAGGVLIGIGALLVLLFACRAAEAAVRSPARSRSPVSRRRRMQAAS
jgi:membrane-associated phospholipid phosphatase